VCAAPESLSAELGAVSKEIDYWRYCTSQCRTISDALNVLCVPDDLTNDIGVRSANGQDFAVDDSEDARSDDGVAASLAAPAPAPAAPPSGNVASPFAEQAEDGSAEGEIVATQASADEKRAVLVLTKVLARRAEENAIAAEKAERAARLAYEGIVNSPRVAAKNASEAALKRLKQEYANLTKQFAQARQKFEEDAREKASRAANTTAMIHKKGASRALEVAAGWENMAKKLDEAASDHEAADAPYASAQVEELRLRANKAHSEAAEFREHVAWHNSEMKTAAAAAYRQALPPGVEPPPSMSG